MNSFEEAAVVNRLRALQNLCSDEEQSSPKAIIFIPGHDGRNNQGSVTALKYLFQFSHGKELFEGVFDETFGVLEDSILIVKRSSVSILYSSPMKKVIETVVHAIPCLVEYEYSTDEENEVDKFQQRKCESFKRMILESISPGDSVGFTVPSSYETVEEVETWPMLQAFALDQIICPTGFFTASYQILDMSLQIESLYRCVDSIYVNESIKLVNTVVRSHMLQLLSGLDTSTVSERQRLSADDILGPLNVLYEFSEMEAVGIIEAFRRPVLLFGENSNEIVNSLKLLDDKWWKGCLVADNFHFVVEASEATTGIRWCRTYFLRTGTDSELVQEIEDLQKLADSAIVDDEDEQEENKWNEESILKRNRAKFSKEAAAAEKILARMQQLYLKLWLNLEHIVQENFLISTDVLEAGTKIQEELIDAMGNAASLGPAVQLYSYEYLQVHMDCMNALGEVITVDDVDDLGGACWTYIRVSVHGIQLHPNGRENGAVAVGDTFLFAPKAYASQIKLLAELIYTVKQEGNDYDKDAPAHSTCITQRIPYLQSFYGSAVEDDYSYYLNRCIKASVIPTEWQLGRSVDLGGMTSLAVKLLTDYSMLLQVDCEIKGYTSGLIIERSQSLSCIPVIFSHARDLARVWTVDLLETIDYNWSQLFGTTLRPNELLLEEIIPGSGCLIVFETKPNRSHLFKVLFPSVPRNAEMNSTVFAIFVEYSNRGSAAFTNLLDQWRVAFRMNDVPESRGEHHLLPHAIFPAIRSLVDSEAVRSQFEEDSNTSLNAEPVSTARLIYYAHNGVGKRYIPGTAYLSMKCLHVVAESLKLRLPDDNDVLSLHSFSRKVKKSNAILVFGLAAHGVEFVGRQLAQQLKASELLKGKTVRELVFDPVKRISKQVAHEYERLRTILTEERVDLLRIFNDELETVSRTDPSAVIIVVLSINPLFTSTVIETILNLLFNNTSITISHICSVTTPSAIVEPTKVVSRRGIGYEQVASIQASILAHCDSAIAIVNAHDDESYFKFRVHLNSKNKEAHIIKFTKTAIFFEEDDLSHILQNLLSSNDQPSERMARGILLYNPQPSLKSSTLWTSLYPSPKSLGCTLQTYIIQPQTLGFQYWQLASLLKLLGVLLPHAKSSVYAISSMWQEYRSRSSGFNRLIELATSKILAKTYEQQISQNFESLLEKLTKQEHEVISQLCYSIVSIYGTVRLHQEIISNSNQSYASACIQSNSALIQIKEATYDEEQEQNGSILIFNGIFSEKSWEVLKKLLSYCEKFPFKLKDILLIENFDLNQCKKIQNLKKYRSLPLPHGWWFDGAFFVDHAGNRSELRPDIAQILKQHVLEENAKIKKYNQFILDRYKT